MFLNQANINVYLADHIAHGPDVEQLALGHWEKGDFNGCIANVHTTYLQTRKKFPTLPFFLLGHSMGSLWPKNTNTSILKIFKGLY